MRRVQLLSLGLGICAAAGCRTATHVVEEPRVDLELSGGNRGYLVGTPPAGSVSNTTRQVVEAEVELPGFFKPSARGVPSGAVTLNQVAPPETDMSEQAATSEDAVPLPGDQSASSSEIYVVKRGDTLWSIAADPKVFGSASQWRRLYNANRDVLKTPDRLRAGMTLHIPRGGSPTQTAGPVEEPRYTK